MGGFGRAPKPEGQRRNPNPVLGGKIRRLSATSHALKAPPWPLLKPTKRELEIWARLWKMPVSVTWESGWPDVVARYVRLLAVAELPKAPGIVLIEVRQLEDRLGLSPMALLRLRWEVVDDDEPRARDQSNVLDVRERLKAVQ